MPHSQQLQQGYEHEACRFKFKNLSATHSVTVISCALSLHYQDAPLQYG